MIATIVKKNNGDYEVIPWVQTPIWMFCSWYTVTNVEEKDMERIKELKWDVQKEVNKILAPYLKI